MTVAQLVMAKELDAEIRRVNEMVIDLESITDYLRVYEHDKGCKSTNIRIEVDYGYKQTPLINLRSLISFLEEQKTKYEQEVDKLNEEFSEL